MAAGFIRLGRLPFRRACIIDRAELICDIGVLISKASTGARDNALCRVFPSTVNNRYAKHGKSLLHICNKQSKHRKTCIRTHQGW